MDKRYDTIESMCHHICNSRTSTLWAQIVPEKEF